MFKRMFSKKQPENVTKSIRCTAAMWDALESLASEAGETANSYVILVLDQYLQVQVENGVLKAPAPTKDEKSAS